MGTVTRSRGTGLRIQAHPKTEASKRVLRLPDFAVGMLIGRFTNQPANDHNVVFASGTGTLRDSHNVNRQWRDFRRRTGRWTDVTAHTFRKTVATVLSQEFDALTASAQLGHSSSAITEQYYIARAHQGPDARQALSAFVATQNGE